MRTKFFRVCSVAGKGEVKLCVASSSGMFKKLLSFMCTPPNTRKGSKETSLRDF